MPNCPVCGKELTAETNDEECSNTPYRHGKHAFYVVPMAKFVEPLGPEGIGSGVIPRVYVSLEELKEKYRNA